MIPAWPALVKNLAKIFLAFRREMCYNNNVKERTKKMNAIKNYTVYTQRMNKTITDKLFFLEHLKPEITTVVDFGCADGALGLALREVSNLKYVGYDIDKTMLDKANLNGINAHSLYYNFDELLNETILSKSVLVLSSVIHEVYSYGNEYDILTFWNRVFNSGFAQIVIRDMGLENNKIAYGKIKPSNAITITNEIYKRHNDYVPMNYYKDYCQLLLKYWYSENWLRESKENYFPITYSEVLEKVANTKYSVAYSNNFVVDFVANKVKTELGLELEHNTHYKLILNL